MNLIKIILGFFMEIVDFLGNEYRNQFARKLVKVLQQLDREGKLPKEMFNARTAVSIGGAFDNDIVMVCLKVFTGIRRINSIDPDFGPYKKFRSMVNYIKKRVEVALSADIQGDDPKLFEMSHVLQVCETDAQKIAVLSGTRKLMKPGEFLIVAEELAMGGIWGVINRNLHYVYNNHGWRDLKDHLQDQSLDDGYSLKRSIVAYEVLAKKAGFKLRVSRLYFRGTFIAIFEAVPL